MRRRWRGLDRNPFFLFNPLAKTVQHPHCTILEIAMAAAVIDISKFQNRVEANEEHLFVISFWIQRSMTSYGKKGR